MVMMAFEQKDDGIVIPESAIAKFGFKTYEKRVVEFGQRAYPLNLYPDDTSGFKIMDEHSGNSVVCKIHPDDKEQ